uniref:BED-type domain-containing protein n=1 Tax=Fagus sylvatica TaxID=28930 RepID=A0A2N9GYS7_FAGSY
MSNTKATPDEQPMTTPDEQPMTTPDEQTMTTPDEQTMTTPDEQTMTTQNDHTMEISNEHTMAMSNEHTMAISNEHTMEISNDHMMEISNDHAMATPDEHAMVIANEHAMVVSNEHAMVVSNEHTMETPYEHIMETPDENKMITTPEVNNELPNSETQPNKRRKKKSIVWEHFTIETVSAGCRRACCKQCKQSFAYSTGSKVAGTSHLKRHIAKGSCIAFQRSQGQNQLSPYTPRSRIVGSGAATDPPKRRYRTPSSPYVAFDQDRCRNEIARMIIMHDYPLHMVEHPGFLAFVQNLQPRFNMVSFNTVQGDCVATYLMEKQSLVKFIEGMPGRVCLTLDTWTSSQTVGYVFITGHFIDSDWKSHKRILNVIMEPYPDSDTALSHAVAACLSDWSLESKLFSLTFNQPLSEVALENLRPLLAIKNPLILNGQLLVGNCIARTFSSVANDVLGAGREIIKKIRDSVKYVKTHQKSHEDKKFFELKQHKQLQVPSERSLSLDDHTQYGTQHIKCWWLLLIVVDPRFKMKLVEFSFSRKSMEFDVLGWWKLNKMKYPTLSKMARDILSIPVSTAGSDSVFDTTSKEMDRYRSSLRPETVEALICAKDWMQYGSSEASNALVRMEY